MWSHICTFRPPHSPPQEAHLGQGIAPPIPAHLDPQNVFLCWTGPTHFLPGALCLNLESISSPLHPPLAVHGRALQLACAGWWSRTNQSLPLLFSLLLSIIECAYFYTIFSFLVNESFVPLCDSEVELARFLTSLGQCSQWMSTVVDTPVHWSIVQVDSHFKSKFPY